MGIISDALVSIARRRNKTIQGENIEQRFRDYHIKAKSYSIEAEISETLANLICMYSSMPIAGESERARWLDNISDEFFQGQLTKATAACFETGDCLVVPSWNGRNIQNILVSSDDFAILETVGNEITAVAYLVDTMSKGQSVYKLYQEVELVPYEANDGSTAYANRYRMFVARDGSLVESSAVSEFPDWEKKYEVEWYIPNVDRLLIGRIKSATTDPTNLNNVKGLPICYGASEPISEIRYLLNQMHNEFGFSEKMIMADKRLFHRVVGRRGETAADLPRGRERLFVALSGQSNEQPIMEWAPDIRYKAYLDDIDKQEQLVERAVGVSRGIISNPNDMNYQNVDNVRKSQQKTISFVNTHRRIIEGCLGDLLYAWDRLANYFNVVPIGDYTVSFDWSDDYVETFSDRQNAILAGNAIGATDAVDYRQFLFDESPETARERVEEIAAASSTFPALTITEA